MSSHVDTKRAYDPPTEEDGARVLVDRYWPRGVQKEQAALEVWLRELAPSPELIAWFGHRVERWDEFKERYWKELSGEQARAALDTLYRLASGGRVTLVYGARDREHNNARALAEYLERQLPDIVHEDYSSAPHRRAPRRFSGDILQWPLMLAGLFSPILALLLIQLALMNGEAGWEILGGGILLASGATVVRCMQRERRARVLDGAPSTADGQSVLVAVAGLSAWAVGPLTGILVLSAAILALSRFSQFFH